MTRIYSTWLTFAVAVVLFMGSIAIPAHAAGSGAGACATSKKIAPRGSVSYGDWQFPTTLNPNQTLLGVALMTNQLQNDALVRYDASGHLYPLLLTALPTRANGGISKDGKAIYLRLKRGLHWSDGTAITSHQIWFAWKIGQDPLSGPACLGTCDKIASIGLPSRYVAVLHMKHVYASAVPRALPGIMIESWHNAAGSWAKNNVHQAAFALYQDPAFTYLGKDYPTTGPYQVTDYKAFNHITLRPNPYYANMSCGAHLAKITFNFYSSKSRLIAAAASHKVDVGLDYYPADLATLRARAANHFSVLDTPSFVYEHLELNVDKTYNGKPNPLASQRVRLAMALAVNKAAILQSALGTSSGVARSIVANNPWVSRPGLKQPYANASINGQWDPVASRYVTPGSSTALRDARKLLQSTRWKSGFAVGAVTTTSQLPARKKMLNQIAAAWTKLGIKTSVTTQQDETLFGTWAANGTLAHGHFQVALFSWVGSPDADSWVNEMGGQYVDRKHPVHSDLNQNYSGFGDATIDRSFSRAASTYNGAVRSASYRAIQQEMNHQAYWIGLYYRDQIATSDGRIKNLKLNPTTAGATWNAYNWTR